MSDEKRIDKALDIAYDYGSAEGDHHRAWVIDQMVRALCPNDDEYMKFRARLSMDLIWWDEGIAP